MKIGNIDIADIKLGASQVSAWLGGVLVWGGEEPGPAGDWLCFTAEQANSTVRLDKVVSPAEIYLECSADDGATWKNYGWSGTTGSRYTLKNVGDKVYFRAKTENSTIGTNSGWYTFVMTGNIAASGNIQTLLKADGSRTDAPDNCYYCMFNGCSSLTTAPELPATTLASGCYTGMFQECQSLTTAPSLPATVLADGCYFGMFKGCTSLTTAPELPATALAIQCYDSMFRSCTSLTTAPELPATALASNCYYEMFLNCTSLSSVEVGFSAWSPTTATTNWLSSVAATGTFTCPAALDTTTRDASHVPVGWTVVNPPAAEPLCFTAIIPGNIALKKNGSPTAISLEYSTDNTTWYDYTWNGNTGLQLTTNNVGDKIYFRAKSENQSFSTDMSNYYSFANYVAPQYAASGNIQSLLKADCSRTDAPSYCYTSLFSGCKWLVQAPELPATTLGNYCYNGMFSNCQKLTSAPELPATTLAEACYRFMFNGCNTLTSAPELPATTLANSCYTNMFQYCSSLSTIKVGFTQWNPSNATSSWLLSIAASGTFTCPTALGTDSTITRGDSNCPTGWTVVNT